jgi:thiazole synthase ThiGH ThiG subunit
MNDPLVIAGKRYASRLFVGTGKYASFEQSCQALEASGRRSSPLRCAASTSRATRASASGAT